MSKYIDADKLIAEIDGILSACTKQTHTGVYNTCNRIKGIITSLQQEQPEVDLEKSLDEYYENADFGPAEAIEYEIHKDIARHFYKLGKNSK